MGDVMEENRRSMKKSAVFSLSLLISFLLLSSAQAAWVPLTDLDPISDLPNASLTVGDKLFSGFDVTGISDGGPPEPSAITVKVEGGQNSSTGDYGLKFRLSWTAGSDQLINAAINFKVSILDGYDPWFMEDAILWLSTASASGTGLVQATENIFDADFLGNCITSLAASSQVDDYGTFLMDSSDFQLYGNPVQMKEIWVRTGFSVQGGSNGAAGVHEIFVLYSQIPEPATILLLGLGALALVRKRKP